MRDPDSGLELRPEIRQRLLESPSRPKESLLSSQDILEQLELLTDGKLCYILCRKTLSENKPYDGSVNPYCENFKSCHQLTEAKEIGVLAFEAGKKVQAVKDRQEIAELEAANQKQSNSLEIMIDKEKDKEQAIAAAKKEGMRELLDWALTPCRHSQIDYAEMPLDCIICLDTKLAELELKH